MGAAVGVAWLGTAPCRGFFQWSHAPANAVPLTPALSPDGGEGDVLRGCRHSNRKIRGVPPPGRPRGDENAVLPGFDRVDMDARAETRRRLHKLGAEANEASGLPDGARASPVPARSRKRPRVFKTLPGGQRAGGYRAVEQPFGPAGEFFAMVYVQRHTAIIRPLRRPGIRFPKFVQPVDSSRRFICALQQFRFDLPYPAPRPKGFSQEQIGNEEAAFKGPGANFFGEGGGPRILG